METVVIIGGGASGIMAALTAAEDKNNKVIVLERQQRIGRKLLATGNGRCNLTNTGAGTAMTRPLPCLLWQLSLLRTRWTFSLPLGL